jgi:Tfp pilus assembly protein PilF
LAASPVTVRYPRTVEAPQYLQKLGAVCLAFTEVDEAIAHLERAAALDPDSPQINYSMGQAWQRKGERQKAAEFIKKFQELKRREEQVEELERTLARGERMLDEGKDAEARAVFEQVVQADPNNWTAHGYLAEMFLGVTDGRKAWPRLARMEELDSNRDFEALPRLVRPVQNQYDRVRA